MTPGWGFITSFLPTCAKALLIDGSNVVGYFGVAGQIMD